MSTPNSMTQAVMALYASIPQQVPPMPSILFFVEVPEDNIQLPLAVYEHRGEPPIAQAYPTGAQKPVALDGRFAITLWGLDVVQLEAWALALMQVFTPNSLQALGGGPHTVMKRENYQLDAAGLRNYEGKPVRSVTMSYHVFIGAPPA